MASIVPPFQVTRVTTIRLSMYELLYHPSPLYPIVVATHATHASCDSCDHHLSSILPFSAWSDKVGWLWLTNFNGVPHRQRTQ